MPDALSLPALLALIEEATPGPWALDEIERLPGWCVVEGPEPEDRVSVSGYRPDAAFIAAFDPPTVRVLIEALQEAVEVWNGLVCPKCGWMPGDVHGLDQGCDLCLSNAVAHVRLSSAITLPEQTS